MLLLTCKCLNVSIGVEGAEIGAADLDQLGVDALERQDPFFATNEVGVVSVGEISKEQAWLVQMRHAGDWLVHECLNCGMHTHAMHKERRAQRVLVNRALLADQHHLLSTSDAFSQVFRILVDRHNDLTPAPPLHTMAKLTALQPIGPLQAGLMCLQHKLQEAVRAQTALVEERIRHFSEQQYADLEAFRKTAHEDQEALARVLQTSPALQRPEVTASKPPLQPPKPDAPKSIIAQPPSFLKQVHHLNKHNPKTRPSSAGCGVSGGEPKTNHFGVVPGSRGQAFGGSTRTSLDTEGLFDLEGMEEPAQEPLHSEDETDDTDESGSHDEGIHIPRHRISTVAANNLARSLPVTVPAFQQNLANPSGFEEEQAARGGYPEDIAASIKALAKSVHGEHNVFGDLPRPRFSTQL